MQDEKPYHGYPGKECEARMATVCQPAYGGSVKG